MNKQILEYIKSKVYKLPTTSGVYKMLDADGNIIYIGKAKNLKRRVGSYFLNTVKQAKVQQMVNMVADFDYICIALKALHCYCSIQELQTKDAPVLPEHTLQRRLRLGR